MDRQTDERLLDIVNILTVSCKRAFWRCRHCLLIVTYIPVFLNCLQALFHSQLNSYVSLSLKLWNILHLIKTFSVCLVACKPFVNIFFNLLFLKSLSFFKISYLKVKIIWFLCSLIRRLSLPLRHTHTRTHRVTHTHTHTNIVTAFVILSRGLLLVWSVCCQTSILQLFLCLSKVSLFVFLFYR